MEMITETQSIFDQMAIETLGNTPGFEGETFHLVSGTNYVSESSNVQLADELNYKGLARELRAQNDNLASDEDEAENQVQEDWDDAQKVQIEFSVDQHGNRYSEVYAIVDQN